MCDHDRLTSHVTEMDIDETAPVRPGNGAAGSAPTPVFVEWAGVP